MAVDLLRQGQVGRHQEGRPVDRVESDDVLADQMHVGRPEPSEFAVLVGIADPGHVGRQRIDPDVHHMVGRSGHLDPPVEAGARDAQITKPAFDKAQHLVAAAFGLDEVGMIAVMGQQAVLIGGEPEEPAFLPGPLHWRALRGQFDAPLAVGQLAFFVKGFISDRIIAFVAVEVEIAGGFHRFPQSHTGGFMSRFGRTNERIVTDVQSIAHLLEI